VQPISIRHEPIELGQLLKMAGLVDTGGQAKWVIQEGLVRVNGQVETRRGRKLLIGDVVEVDGGPPRRLVADDQAEDL
jgi:ribosome-associated protein